MSYTEKVLEHFKSPHNQGALANANAVGEDGNPVCGDVMKIYLDIQKNDQGVEYIKDIGFETLGCAAAIAVSSAMTDLAKGMTLDEAMKLEKDKIVNDLGGLPAPKIHCSMLGVDALKKAITNYRSSK